MASGRTALTAFHNPISKFTVTREGQPGSTKIGPNFATSRNSLRYVHCLFEIKTSINIRIIILRKFHSYIKNKKVGIHFTQQGCGSAFILCGSGSSSSSFSECGYGSRSTWTKFEEKKHEKFSQVVKNIKHCSKLRNNRACENLLLKKCN